MSETYRVLFKLTLSTPRITGNADVVILPRSNDVRPTSTANAVKAEPAPPKLKDILFVHPSRAKAAHQWEDRRRPKPAQKRLGTYRRNFSAVPCCVRPVHTDQMTFAPLS